MNDDVCEFTDVKKVSFTAAVVPMISETAYCVYPHMFQGMDGDIIRLCSVCYSSLNPPGWQVNIDTVLIVVGPKVKFDSWARLATTSRQLEPFCSPLFVSE